MRNERGIRGVLTDNSRGRINRINKRGQKYNIIFGLIIGLMVVSISFFFIFNEYFTSDDIGMEACRQSIQLRSLLPETELGGFNFNSFRDSYPLKCKTNVVDIDVRDMQDGNYKKIIGDTVAQCWALFDKGDSNAFPSSVYTDDKILVRSTCVPCARIHLTEDAKDYINDNNEVKINIRDILMDERMDQGYSYYSYLNNSGKKFPAFNLAGGRAFDLNGDKFVVDTNDKERATLKNRLTGAIKFEGKEYEKNIYSLLDLSRVSLPMIFDPKDGDLMINYGIATISIKLSTGDYVPYLFYFQSGQDNPSPFDELTHQFADGPSWANMDFCESWEGIPA